MQWRRVFGDRIVLALVLVAQVCAVNPLTLNGWHPCTMDTGVTTNMSIQAQCATVTMPLCHSDVCIDNENRTVEVFVKRLVSTNTTTKRNFWFFPDHPFAMSVQDVERQMISMYLQLLGNVNVYLMDQRGTGRGTLFDCEASKATTTTSPLGVLVAPSEVASCANALRTKFGNNFAATFSLTSAARDVVTFISTFQAQTKVFLYGVGFGTLLVERTMHFASEEIVGFVLDSTETTSGGTKTEFPYRSRSDKDFGGVFKAFLSLCNNDTTCSGRFNGTKPENVLQNVLTSIDKTDSTCATVAQALRDADESRLSPVEPASHALRRMLATMLRDPALRPFIPAIIYRFNRCNMDDMDVLLTFNLNLRQRVDFQRQTLVNSTNVGAAMLVYNMIQYSEMWETPTPSLSELVLRFTKTLASSGIGYTEFQRSCVFRRDLTSPCLAFTANSSNNSLVYRRDDNWNQPATIKEQASVLFLASRYDGDAPVSYAQTLMNALDGDSKQLLVFEAASHNVLRNTPLLSTTADRSFVVSPSCPHNVLGSFVDNDGDLTQLDTECMTQLPSNVSLSISETMSVDILGVVDPYDGIIPRLSDDGSSKSGSSSQPMITESPSVSVPQQNSSTASLVSSRNRYRTAFIVILVVAVLLLVVVIILLYRARKKRLLAAEEQQLRQLRGEEVDDMAFLRDLYNPSPSEWFNYRSNRMHL